MSRQEGFYVLIEALIKLKPRSFYGPPDPTENPVGMTFGKTTFKPEYKWQSFNESRVPSGAGYRMW